MFKTYFKDYDITDTKYCYIRLKGHNPINTLHIATLRMKFSCIDNKLLTAHIAEHALTAYPELHKAIQETLFPLLKGEHKNNAENIINTFMLIYADVT
mgnify:CR=1 FL=1